MSQHEVAVEVAKAAPPVAVTTWITMVSSDIDLWIKALTVVFLVLQIGWQVAKFFNKDKDK